MASAANISKPPTPSPWLIKRERDARDRGGEGRGGGGGGEGRGGRGKSSKNRAHPLREGEEREEEKGSRVEVNIFEEQWKQPLMFHLLSIAFPDRRNLRHARSQKFMACTQSFLESSKNSGNDPNRRILLQIVTEWHGWKSFPWICHGLNVLSDVLAGYILAT